MEEALLEVNDLVIRFRRDGGVSHAVNSVSFRVYEGESLGIVGESGSGKSVSVKAVMKLLPKHAKFEGGDITFAGRSILPLSEGAIRHLRGREVALIFQDPHAYLNPTKTIGAQMVEPLLFHRMATKSEALVQAIDLLRQVGIPSPELRVKQYPFEFSGGMLQRVMIAMALIAKPKLLIADEPTTALDVTVQAQILQVLRRLKQERRMSLILVTHDLVVAANTCDRIVVMYGGRVVEQLPSQALLSQSQHPYTRGLIACTPSVRGERTLPTPIGGAPLNLRRPLPVGCLFAERCPHCMERCRSESPVLKTVALGHEVACFLAEPQTSGVSA
ncbi:MAG: ABC transporter ATP-binding protein [Firmicutes bacterium]|nr:ABC transporter ATP-binding protein [Bacillota bacterium]